MKRKRICLVTISPESEYTSRVMKGVLSQCKKYGYDVVVVTAMVSICNYYKNYLHGELNIYNLINFELFDGFIITPIPMTEDHNMLLYDKLVDFFKGCTKPVIALDKEFADFPVIYTDDKTPFKKITEHLIKIHGCRDFDILTGPDTSQLTNMRLNGILEVFNENKIKIDENRIFRGDYWYFSGERLANRYASGELNLPDAVICLSDHMAIGLINRLKKNNIRVPDDVIVTGFGAIREAAMNTPPVTSYVPYQAEAGAEAVNWIRALIDFQATVQPYDDFSKDNLKIGASCGCEEDLSYTRGLFLHESDNTKYKSGDTSVWNNISMTMLHESYMAENLTASEDPFSCLGKIYDSKYLIRPYKRFFICLNDNWLAIDSDITDGYTDRVLLAVEADTSSKLHGWFHHVFIDEGHEKYFSRSQMLPAFEEDLKKEFNAPQVFYFTPLHFGMVSLGYAVLQNDLDEPGVIGEVYRNYLRNINNALEMTRAKYRSIYLAEHDAMTGLKNRRGLEHSIVSRIAGAGKDAKIFAIVIDMNDLKNRNDTYGHSEGDKGIKLVAEAVKSITEDNEICVRGGGDEFFVFGVGDYTDQLMNEKVAAFRNYLKSANENMTIPVEASIGYCLKLLTDHEDFQIVLDKADVKMYEDKQSKKSGAKK